MRTSAGCVVRAHFPDGLRFLLVHPSGNYNRRAPWSIPKGGLDPGESPEDCAVRETREKAGLASRILAPLGEVVYGKSRKRVVGFLAEALSAPAETVLPCGSWEVDRVEFLTLEEARAKIHPDQAAFLDRAMEHLRERRTAGGVDHPGVPS